MESNRKPISKFVEENKIKMKVEPADSNPAMDSDQPMDHWKCVLKHDGKRMTVYFSKGMGHCGKEPDAIEVLSCLSSDAASYENARSFEEFCGDFGYDTDSRRAERIYKSIEKQAVQLQRLLGEELYEELLWNCEED